MLTRCISVRMKRPVAWGLRTLSTGHPNASSKSSGEKNDLDSENSKKKVVVFGGSGFVGQSVCRAALKLGAEVVSVNRSGAPAGKEWASDVRWIRGDIFEPENYAEELSGAAGAISCVGAFGSDAFMEKICGDATVVATEAAKQAGVERFVFISAAGSQHQHQHLVLKGYWKGKMKAEAAIRKLFPEDGVILRAPGIYGNREVGSVALPLGLVMKPAEMVRSGAPEATRMGTHGSVMLLCSPHGLARMRGTWNDSGPSKRCAYCSRYDKSWYCAPEESPTLACPSESIR